MRTKFIHINREPIVNWPKTRNDHLHYDTALTFRAFSVLVLALSFIHTPLYNVDAGIFITPLRATLVLSSTILIASLSLTPKINTGLALALLTFIACILSFKISAIASYPNPIHTRAIAHYIFGTAIATITAAYFIKKRPTNFLLKTVLTLTYAGFILAFWESLTGSHLPTSKIHNLDHQGWSPVTGTYFNRNDFSYALNIASAFLLSLSINKKASTSLKAAILVALFLSTTIFVLNSANAAILTIILQLIISLYFISTRRPQNLSNGTLRTVYLVSSIPLFISLFFSMGLFSYFSNLNPFGTTGGSATIRFNIHACSFNALIERKGIGVGPGNSNVALESCNYYTHNIIDPHSFILETITEIGIFALIPAAFLVISKYIYNKKLSTSTTTSESITSWLFGITIIIGSLGPSSASGMPIHWVALGTFVGSLFKKN
ncbi:hypothetical protein A6K26_000020 [Gammaproteobacteria bacterium 2W06]|nr:hypothetical protein A6K26_000020 [Gammaproteobacteria bacterium 2W06]